jgi:DNA-binding CsgD family transcriptional regulator
MKKRWTQDEVLFLKENWGNLRLEAIIATLGRTEDSIARKAMRVGLDTHKKDDEILKKRWTQEQDNFLIKNYKVLSIEEIVKHIDRTANAIEKRAVTLGIASALKRWTKDEEMFLKEKWGIICLSTIAKRLNRSTSAVMLKAHKLSLKEQITASGTYLTPADIGNILGINKRTIYTWIDKEYIKYKKFKIGKKKMYQVTIDDLCEFMKVHKELWDSGKADMQQIKSYYISYSLSSNGKLKVQEDLPNWLIEKINKDKEEFKILYKPWTTGEERELIDMTSLNYRYKDICARLGRSMESIKTKVYNLNRRQYDQTITVKCNQWSC